MSPNVKYPAKLSCQFPVKVARDMTWNRKSMAAKRASQGIPEGICGAEAVYLLTAEGTYACRAHACSYALNALVNDGRIKKL